MTVLKVTLLLTVLISQSGCGATPTKEMQSAVLSEPSVATTKVLNRFVSGALNGTKVSLARGVLTKRSELQVERMAQDPASMPGLNGMMMGMPDVYRFSLKAQGDSCFLVYLKTGQVYPLDGVKCRVL